jgi:hypothetical protein
MVLTSEGGCILSKVILIPIERLSFEDLRKAFKQAKADARVTKAASNVEGERDGSKTT